MSNNVLLWRKKLFPLSLKIGINKVNTQRGSPQSLSLCKYVKKFKACNAILNRFGNNEMRVLIFVWISYLVQYGTNLSRGDWKHIRHLLVGPRLNDENYNQFCWKIIVIRSNLPPPKNVPQCVQICHLLVWPIYQAQWWKLQSILLKNHRYPQ